MCGQVRPQLSYSRMMLIGILEILDATPIGYMGSEGAGTLISLLAPLSPIFTCEFIHILSRFPYYNTLAFRLCQVLLRKNIFKFPNNMNAQLN